MNILEPGEEGYIVRVTAENCKYLSEICGWKLSLDRIFNYDPNMESELSTSFFSYSKSSDSNSYITSDSTEITVEQLQQILFIQSLEN